jgi:hypothetical protein
MSHKQVIFAPSIHMNGSDADTLFESYAEAAASVRKALKAMEDASPNARDYYVQGADAYGQAVKQHVARADKLLEVQKEIFEILESIGDARDIKNSRANRSR